MAEARRYDREGTGVWTLETRQRYRYDAGNVRTVKLTSSGGIDRASLYVLPGDFERRGVAVDIDAMNGDAWRAVAGVNTETQYLVAGARVVWKKSPEMDAGGGENFETDVRITVPLADLLQSTVASMDLVSGELLEVGTYYPSGNREMLVARDSSVDGQTFQLEPIGFTGKEGDDDVGLVYFGERYLMPHLGRWASADPLQVHAGGGGEFGNSYHYVSGNLLQARDPLGLSGPVKKNPGVQLEASTDYTERVHSQTEQFQVGEWEAFQRQAREHVGWTAMRERAAALVEGSATLHEAWSAAREAGGDHAEVSIRYVWERRAEGAPETIARIEFALIDAAPAPPPPPPPPDDDPVSYVEERDPSVTIEAPRAIDVPYGVTLGLGGFAMIAGDRERRVHVGVYLQIGFDGTAKVSDFGAYVGAQVAMTNNRGIEFGAQIDASLQPVIGALSGAEYTLEAGNSGWGERNIAMQGALSEDGMESPDSLTIGQTHHASFNLAPVTIETHGGVGQEAYLSLPALVESLLE